MSLKVKDKAPNFKLVASDLKYTEVLDDTGQLFNFEAIKSSLN